MPLLTPGGAFARVVGTVDGGRRTPSVTAGAAALSAGVQLQEEEIGRAGSVITSRWMLSSVFPPLREQ